MSIRSVFFWAHLSAGVVAGLVILTMSATGVLLTYERQLVASAEKDVFRIDPTTRISVDEMATIAAGVHPSAELSIPDDRAAPVRFYVGRDKHLMNPSNGRILRNVETKTERFMDDMVRFHRWFSLTGDSRATGKAITGAANLLFIFLALSGAYLWLPPVMRWSATKVRLVFRRSYATGHARDYNWHHVFSVWMLIPIIVMATTATVFNYRWANELVYAAYGEDVPQRGRGGSTVEAPAPAADAALGLTLQARFDAMAAAYPGWQTISLDADSLRALPTAFGVDMGNGAQHHKRFTATVQPDGSITDQNRPFDARTPGGKARITIRFLHTGEVLGWFGQTLAGLGSLAGMFLVWTGLALSYRRLIRPLFNKNKAGDKA
ncbi:PepSY-associated TM helix domain-containing protein [Kordiimonas aquimaris]|uniref:PepSY-associated TM helix domain-containing protein n=1 Tax=Kordiimonas aquimaris TaxID=707591 RepID=UPI0021D01A69|nr:PepSY-associated TM helix domain-containing protein [Kordiimonas aquimaris]